jgi:aromatic-L-amino-acid decarboxylase
MSGEESRPLEPSADEMRRLVKEATERVVRHIESLPDQPAAYFEGGEELARSLIADLPERGRPFEDLMDLLFERIVPKTFNTAGPGYLAYIPGGGLFHTAVADFVAASINRYVGVWLAAPGLVQLETNVVRWFCSMVGLPEGSGGLLTTGGSLANFSAIVTARRERLPEDFLAGVLYASDQVHHSVTKAAILAGFPERNIRRVASDGSFSMRLDDLRQRIAEDRSEGLAPFLVVASAGTTNSGAVDDLAALAALCREEELWFHVDAAYGGFFVLTDRGRRRLTGLAEADSLALDPHKGLFLPYGTGCLLVRDPAALRRAHTASADYMPSLQDDPDLVDFCEISPELSRGFRGLRVWLPLEMHGIGPFRAALDEKLDLTEHAAASLAATDGIEIVAPPQLSIVAFRWKPAWCPTGELDALNRELLERTNRRGRVYLTGTLLGDRFVIRICVLSFRTHRDRVDQALEDLRAAMEGIRAQRKGGVYSASP